jgi:hypothetical protein
MIKDFVSEIKRGAVARTNRFAILFTPPVAVDAKGTPTNPDYSSLRKILLFADSVQLPGVNFSTIQNRAYGEFREVPYEKLFDNINMSFYVDQDLKVKKLFDQWINGIQNPRTRTFNYYNNYTTNMVIEVQDLNDKTRYEVVLHECYPKTMSSIQLDASNKDVMKLQVSMQYKYWTASTISVLNDDQKIPGGLLGKFTKDFSGFQETLNKTLGERAGNFITGSALTYGVTKIPGLLKF